MHPAIYALKTLNLYLPSMLKMASTERQSVKIRPADPSLMLFRKDWLALVKKVALKDRKNIGRSVDALQTFLNRAIDYVPVLMAWNNQRQVYRFDSTIKEHLGNTDGTSELPLELLTRMPYNTFFVEDHSSYVEKGVETNICGFMVSLQQQHDVNQKIIHTLSVLPFPTDMENGTPGSKHIGNIFASMFMANINGETFEKSAAKYGHTLEALFDSIQRKDRIKDGFEEWLQTRLNFIFYLCSHEPDIAQGVAPPKPTPQKTLTNTATKPIKPISYWDVGFREGATFKKSLENAEKNTHTADETEADNNSKKPHWRRAHWHRFWAGPRAEVEKRHLTVKWVNCVVVLGKHAQPDTLPAVRHRVMAG